MGYAEDLPEDRPIAIACKIAEKAGFEYRIRSMECDEVGCSGPFVDIIVSWEWTGFLGLWKKPKCCAVIELCVDCNMRIYGDAYRHSMLDFAENLERELSVRAYPKRYDGRFMVKFLSHEPRIIW